MRFANKSLQALLPSTALKAECNGGGKSHPLPPTSREGEDFLETAKARTSKGLQTGRIWAFPPKGLQQSPEQNAAARTSAVSDPLPAAVSEFLSHSSQSATQVLPGCAADSCFSRAGPKQATCGASAEQRTVQTATAGPRESSKSQRKPHNALLPPASKGQRCPTGRGGKERAGTAAGSSHTRDPHPTHLTGRPWHRPPPRPPLKIPRPAREHRSPRSPRGYVALAGHEDRQTEVVVAVTVLAGCQQPVLLPPTRSSLQPSAELLFLDLPFPLSSPTPVFIESPSLPMLKKIPCLLGTVWTQHSNYQRGKKRHQPGSRGGWHQASSTGTR